MSVSGAAPAPHAAPGSPGSGASPQPEPVAHTTHMQYEVAAVAARVEVLFAVGASGLSPLGAPS